MLPQQFPRYNILCNTQLILAILYTGNDTASKLSMAAKKTHLSNSEEKLKWGTCGVHENH